MSFMDLDAGEVLLKKRAVDLELDDMMPYCMALTKDVLHFRIIFDGKSRTLLRWLRAQYGKSNAGLIIKWIFFEYGGLRNNEPFSLSWFSIKNKWWIDQMYAQATRAYAPSVPKKESNFLTFEEFLNTPYVAPKTAVSA